MKLFESICIKFQNKFLIYLNLNTFKKYLLEYYIIPSNIRFVIIIVTKGHFISRNH